MPCLLLNDLIGYDMLLLEERDTRDYQVHMLPGTKELKNSDSLCIYRTTPLLTALVVIGAVGTLAKSKELDSGFILAPSTPAAVDRENGVQSFESVNCISELPVQANMLLTGYRYFSGTLVLSGM